MTSTPTMIAHRPTGRLLLALAMLALGLWFPLGAAEPAPASTPATDQAPVYVVTIHPLAAIVREVVGERGRVERLLPPAASPHTYEPRPADAALVEQATALIHGDALLDGWAARLPARHTLALFALLPQDFRLPMVAHTHGPEEAAPAGETHDPAHEHDHEHDGDEAGAQDPHFWSDPLAIKALLPALAAELSKLDPTGQATYQANAAAFAGRLDALDAELKQTLAPVRGRAVLLFHPSLNYMLKRYGLVFAGAIEPFPGKEASPRYLQQLLARIREQQVRAIFTEPQLPPRPARVIAEAAGLPLHELDPNGGREGRATCEEILRYNARTLAEALK